MEILTDLRGYSGFVFLIMPVIIVRRLHIVVMVDCTVRCTGPLTDPI